MHLDAYQGQIKQERENRLAMQQELERLKGMLLITLDSCHGHSSLKSQRYPPFHCIRMNIEKLQHLSSRNYCSEPSFCVVVSFQVLIHYIDWLDELIESQYCCNLNYCLNFARNYKKERDIWVWPYMCGAGVIWSLPSITFYLSIAHLIILLAAIIEHLTAEAVSA